MSRRNNHETKNAEGVNGPMKFPWKPTEYVWRCYGKKCLNNGEFFGFVRKTANGYQCVVLLQTSICFFYPTCTSTVSAGMFFYINVCGILLTWYSLYSSHTVNECYDRKPNPEEEYRYHQTSGCDGEYILIAEPGNVESFRQPQAMFDVFIHPVVTFCL